MRDLTEEELKLAPEWATHYLIDDVYGFVIYESEDLCWWLDLDNPIDNYTFDANESKPINRRSFDISEHEFGDTVGLVELDGGELTLNCGTGNNYVDLRKDDAIAIAKALGVIGDDLK